MKDPTIPDPKERKKFMFYDTEKRQADLRIRCQYDGINQSQFFRMMMTGYLESDPLISEYMEKCKQRYSIHGKQKSKYIKKMHSESQDTKNKFALDVNEIESIFDIIQEEHPEL
tara:strand:- start:312 stop:653 length:342 start_codon:yes stop_codon:yes gene_type:complete